jgi:hypothetical protein
MFASPPTPPDPPQPTPRSQRLSREELQQAVMHLNNADPPANGDTLALILNDMEFTEPINVGQLLGARNNYMPVACDFAWKVTNCTFLEGFSARFVDFKQDFKIRAAEFYGEHTFFEQVIFDCDLTHFDRVKFNSANTYFSGAKFKAKRTLFFKCLFNGEQANFSKSEFVGTNTDFFSCRFNTNDIGFSEAVFSGESVDFIDTRFNGHETWFSYVKFNSNATCFSGVNFSSEKINFSYATLNKSLSFKSVWFQNNQILQFEAITFAEQGSLTLDDCQFEDTACIKFTNIKPKERKEVIHIRQEALTQATEGERRRYQFNNCTFRPGNVLVSQLDTTLLQVTGGNGLNGFVFEHCHWAEQNASGWLGWGLSFRRAPDDDGLLNKSNNELVRRRMTYERLKKEAENQGNSQLASDFYFWQMWYQYHTADNDDSKRVKWFYLVTSGFGLSMLRPLLWFGVVIAVFTAFYAALLGFVTGGFNWAAGFILLLALTLSPGNPCKGVHWDYLATSGVRPLLWLGVFTALYVALLGFITGGVSLEAGFKLVLALTLSPGNPSVCLTGVLPAAEPVHYLRSVTWWQFGLFWLAFMAQNAIGLYLLFQFGAAIRNKVKR